MTTPASTLTPPDTELRDAARAVVERWDTPSWKEAPATGSFINRLRRALETPAHSPATPIDMVLHCPRCGLQHVDRRDPPYSADWDDAQAWTNPPHRSHLCRPSDGGCGHIFRPADVPTNGVLAIKTRGQHDSTISADGARGSAYDRLDADARGEPVASDQEFRNTRARTLLAHLWRTYDSAGTSMGRSHQAVVLEAAMALLGDPDQSDIQLLDADSGRLVNETRSYLSNRMARRLGFPDKNGADKP
jgi:hypothetical protein